MIGDATQRFGRWARSTDIPGGHTSILLDLNATFKSSLPNSVTACVTYLDDNTGGARNWKLDWGGALSAPVTVNNSGVWKIASITIPKTQITNTVSGIHTFALTSFGKDVTFHMLEIIESGSCPTP